MNPSMQRSTKQRTAIQQAMTQADRPLAPQEVLELAQATLPGLGIATVYRALKAMAEEGLLREVHLPGRSPMYEVAHHGHHHHFQCRVCARVFDVHACPGDLASLAPPGFEVDSHEITLYGLCSDCAAQPA